jgi:hypothetical protein
VEDVERAVRLALGEPLPGSSPGTMVIVGPARGGRMLKVVRSAVDDGYIISAYWA